MSKTSILQQTKKHLVEIIALGCFIALVVWGCMDEIDGMNNAATSYDYCHHLCQLFEHISKTVFLVIYGIICYLTYSKKQYSKWSLWLFYVSAVVIVVHYFVGGEVFEYVCHHIGAEKYGKSAIAGSRRLRRPRILYYAIFFLYAQNNQGHIEAKARTRTYYIISLWDRL